MKNDNETLELIADNIVEITMADPLTDDECVRLVQSLERYGIETVINSHGRIIHCEVESDESMKDILGDMADMGLVEDIGLIKIITTLEPQWSNELSIVVDME